MPIYRDPDEPEDPVQISGDPHPLQQAAHAWLSETPGVLKRKRFERLAVKRTRRAIAALRILARCGNRAAYDYTPAEAEQLINALKIEVESLEDAFKPPESNQLELFDFRSVS